MGELLKNQLARTRSVLLKQTEGLAPEVLSFIPDGLRNNIHWQLGHILVTAELFFLPEKKFTNQYWSFFGAGTQPADWTEDVPTVEVLLAHLAEQAKTLQQMDVPNPDTLFEEPKFGNKTVGEFLAMGAYHESMHVGQIHTIKRIAEAALVKSAN
ncbi:MAG: DinB family protein [Solibacillus sp.]